MKDGTIVIRLKLDKNDVNIRLVNFISETLKISKDRIQLIAGEEGNNKLISITDMKPKEIQKMILALLP
jgi:uncharacterized protein YggU (UPF0235/DUF167 family)